MADRAARWVDTLLPRVAVRQVVVTVPWPRRWLLARKPDLARGVLAIAQREVQRWLQRVGTGQRDGQTGSITVVQRFGSALNLNLPPTEDGALSGVGRGVRGRPEDRSLAVAPVAPVDHRGCGGAGGSNRRPCRGMAGASRVRHGGCG